jgi:hypothetical protein
MTIASLNTGSMSMRNSSSGSSHESHPILPEINHSRLSQVLAEPKVQLSFLSSRINPDGDQRNAPNQAGVVRRRMSWARSCGLPTSRPGEAGELPQRST